MQIHALMADRHLACNLLGAPLNAKVEVHIGPDLVIDTAGITAALLLLRYTIPGSHQEKQWQMKCSSVLNIVPGSSFAGQ